MRLKCLAQEHNTCIMIRPGLEPGPLDPASSVLTIEPPGCDENEPILYLI